MNANLMLDITSHPHLGKVTTPLLAPTLSHLAILYCRVVPAEFMRRVNSLRRYLPQKSLERVHLIQN